MALIHVKMKQVGTGELPLRAQVTYGVQYGFWAAYADVDLGHNFLKFL